MTSRTSIFFVEISTLLEPSWSGIANVTANLARALIRQRQEVRFFAFDKLLHNRFVENALRTNDGSGLRLLLEYGEAASGSLPSRQKDGRLEVGIYPNFKRGYQQFDRELLIVHDLSFILTPELHEPHLVADYMEKIFRDSHQVDRVVCVSNATQEDLISYYGVPPSKVSVVHPGVDPDPLLIDGANDDDELQALSLVADGYFLVLGTIEPRKNVELVVDYVASNPSTLNTHKFVFAGRNGWGRTFQTICSTRGLMDPRVMHFGYVSESQRRLLLRNCAALLFPSWFEGFGLPILEAMAAGVPVIASRSSSIIEVGGDPLLAFEPGSTDSFSNAIDAFVRMNASDRKTLKVACMKHAANFSWHRFAEQVAGACIRN